MNDHTCTKLVFDRTGFFPKKCGRLAKYAVQQEGRNETLYVCAIHVKRWERNQKSANAAINKVSITSL